MLEPAAGLPPLALDAIAGLERRVIEVDGGRLKLEWGRLRGRSGDRVEDLLWWEGDRLVGFLGIYGFETVPELAGMVEPDARRRGIGTALLDAAMSLCRERSDRRPLLIVPRASPAGKRLALRRDGVLSNAVPVEEITRPRGPPPSVARSTSPGQEEPPVVGTPAEIVDRLAPFLEAGVQRVYLQFLDMSDLDHLQFVRERGRQPVQAERQSVRYGCQGFAISRCAGTENGA